jgi:hypothetical protein
MSDDDPVRRETAQLAAELSRIGPPPARVHAPPPPPAPTEVDEPVVDGAEEPLPPPDAEGSGSSAGELEPERPPRRSSPRRRSSVAEHDSATTVAELSSGPVNITITLTLRAADLLEGARAAAVGDGDVPRATLREVVLNAVRDNTEELRRRHPVSVDPSGSIPRVRVKKRRRLEGYGKKVPVRLYRVEKEALDALADELDVSVSAMVTQALELTYG